MAEVKCSTCGQLNPEDHNFCDHCNAPLFSYESLAEDETSLRDDFQLEDPAFAPEPPRAPTDDKGSSDDYIPSDDSLIANLRDGTVASSGEDDASRLDDLLAPLPGETIPAEPAAHDSLDESSRLDEYLGAEETPEEDLIDRMLPKEPPLEKTTSDPASEPPPALDPFLEPDPRADLLGDFSSEESKLDSWDLFSEPEDAKEQPSASSEDLGSPGEWEYITPGPEETAPEKEEPADEFDFLASLTAEDPEPSPEEEPEELAPEWDFPDLSLPEEPTPETPASEPAPEWDFLTSPDSAESGKPEEQPAGEIPGDWDFLTSPDTPEPGSPAESPSLDTPSNWDFLTAPGSEEPESPPGLPTQEAAGSGWDFLTSPDQEPPSSPPVQADAEPPIEEQEPPIPASREAEVPEDLDFLAADKAAGPVTIGFSPDLDDEKDSIPEFGSPGFEEESGWIDMLAEPGERREAEPEAFPEPKKPQTDWLDKIKRLNKSSEMVDEDSSFPDWLSVSDRSAREEPEMSEPPPRAEVQAEEDPAAPASALPDWLQIDDDDESLNEFLRKKDLTNEEYKPAIVRGITDKLPPQEDEEDEDAPATGLSDSQQIKFPSWAGDGAKPQEKVPEGMEFLAGQEGSGPVDPFQMEQEEDIDDLFSEELPSWLTSDPSESAFEDFEVELTAGDLPGWVEAMRPVVESTDASGLADDEDYIENYGPLAGIPSVLPAEAEGVLDPEKVSRKPLDLVATKSQLDYMEVLKRLIADEKKSKTILKPAPIATQRVLRWLIAIILLVTTAGTVVFGGQITAEPPTAAQAMNTGYGALYDQIEALHDTQPVLIAFDYQPAAAGELHTAAAGVVDHLMKQGTYLSFVSTQPTGPALAENFLATTQSQHNYRHTQQYINLGYLPGEAAGLVSFVIAPKQIIPLAFDGSNAWQAPPLLGVNSITDFEMILVITDDPETAKVWIEQVGTILGDKTLNMVVSAQVEPMIQPYFRSSPQYLNGYVAGIIDSMNYEQLLGRPNLANKVWLPFNLGIIITVSTIFIGGLANGVLSLFSRHRSRSTAEVKK